MRPASLLAALLLSGAMPLAAAPALRDLAVLKDPHGTETIETVASATAATAGPDRFSPLPSGILAAGYTRAAHWLRFRVEAPAGEWWLEILPPFLDDLRLYERDPARPGAFLERRAGDRLPFSAREVPYRCFVFKLRLEEGGSRTFWLRVETTSSSMVVPRLWAPDDFHAAIPGEYGLLLALIGVLVAVILLAGVSWYWLREQVHLLFIAHFLSLVLFFVGAGGFAAQYLLPSHPAVTDAWVGVASLVSASLGSLLYREVLQVERRQRLTYGLYQVAIVVPLAGLGAMALGFFREAMVAVQALLVLMILVGISLAFRLWRRRMAGGGFLFAAILASLLGALANTSAFLLGLGRGHLLLLYGLNFSAVGGVLALYVAIGARYRALREERERAERDAVRERGIREQQGRFIDVVTHEYRTPLAILRTNLDILALTDDDPRHRVRHESMGVALRRLAEIFDGTLRRGDWGGHRRVSIEPLDLEPLVGRLAREAAAAWPDRSRRVDFRSDGPAFVRADPRLLETVFLNLLDNAGKYAAAGSRVDVRLSRQGAGSGADIAEVVVSNAFAADPGRDSQALLERSVRGANAEGIPGDGMGLYLVKKLVGDLGGRLALSLETPGRFEVAVSFPLATMEGSA